MWFGTLTNLVLRLTKILTFTNLPMSEKLFTTKIWNFRTLLTISCFLEFSKRRVTDLDHELAAREVGCAEVSSTGVVSAVTFLLQLLILFWRCLLTRGILRLRVTVFNLGSRCSFVEHTTRGFQNFGDFCQECGRQGLLSAPGGRGPKYPTLEFKSGGPRSCCGRYEPKTI